MVLNYIWIGFFAIAFIIAVIQLLMGNTEAFPAIMNSTFDNAKTAFEISLGLTGVLSLWMGIMKIGESNAQEIHNELSATWKFVKGTLIAGAIAKDTAFGGKIADIHGPEDRTDKTFLNGKSTLRYQEVGGALAITPWYFATLKTSYTRFFGDYEGFRATLSGSIQF